MTGIELIAAERKRQIEVEGWTAEHDAEHWNGSLVKAATCYANGSKLFERTFGNESNRVTLRFDLWPWNEKWWKPSDDTTTEGQIRNLVKAGALIAAEIDRKLNIKP